VASTTETVKFLKESFHKLANNQEIDLHKLKLLVTLKIDEMEIFSQTLLNNIFAAEDYDFLHRHSVNVMVLALAIARKLEFKKNWQAEISIAALLHDVGMAKISRDYYINSKKFQFEEYFEIFKHPILGIDYLTLGLQSRFGGLISLAVYQHHERLDGSGYPKGRKGKGISEYARIIGICDVFDAMTSDRPWRKKNSPMEAFRFLADNAEILFDRKIVDLLGEILIEQGMLREDQLSCTGQNTNPIVIADTSPYNLWYVCQLLRQNRIPVFAASNKEDLINASTRLKPQVILIDASMSDRKGIDLIQLLRNLPTTQAVPMIYCSDSGDKQDVVMAIQLGIKDYLKKPYTFDFVVNRLAKYINN
jgi:HD-GYP domain-containing protein (c-di-GMP phosphodiesterase class II)